MFYVLNYNYLIIDYILNTYLADSNYMCRLVHTGMKTSGQQYIRLHTRCATTWTNWSDMNAVRNSQATKCKISC